MRTARTGTAAIVLIAGLVAAMTCPADARPSGATPTHSRLPVAAIGSRAVPTPTPPDDIVRPAGASVPRGSSRTVAAAKTTTTKVLVILAYWNKKDSVTTAKAKKVVVTDSDTWYRNASYGRQRLTGTATRWVKIAKQRCGDISTVGVAEKAARKIGYDSRKYNRTVVYEPCSPGPTGLGDISGRRILLFQQGLSVATVVHEMGHNYGLEHANSWNCTKSGRYVSYTAGASCNAGEYGDRSSSMGLDQGSNIAPDFAAPHKLQLGWLTGRTVTLTTTKSVRLTPFETTAAGYKAAKVPGTSGRTYWIEYRTASGNDKTLPAEVRGVVLHMVFNSRSVPARASRSLLLEMVPDNGDFDGPDTSRASLPLRSSWTSPEGIRFTVTAATGAAATVKVTRGAKVSAPGAVGALSAAAGDGFVDVSFTRAADGGKVIRYYRVTASPSGLSYRVSNFGSSNTVRVRMEGLENGTKYTFTVKPRSEVGDGPARTAQATPFESVPTVAITSPAAGSVRGVVKINATATPDPVRHGAITRLEFFVDGYFLGSSDDASGSVDWDTGLGDGTTGAHTVTVLAYDVNGRTGRATRSVTVTATTAPTVVISTPAAGAAAGDTVHVSGTATKHSPDPITNVDVFVGDDNFPVMSSSTAAPFSFDVDMTTYAPGPITLRVVASDVAGRAGASSVVVNNPDRRPTVSISAPASGATLGSTTDVSALVSHRLSTAADLYVQVSVRDAAGDITDLGGTSANVASGKTATVTIDDLDTSELAAGAYALVVTAYDENGRSRSAEVPVKK